MSLPPWVAWVQALGPMGAFTVGVIAAIIAWRSYRRQKEADRRSEFWRRVEWAVGQCGGGDVHEANMGVAVLTALAESSIVVPDDLRLLRQLNRSVVERVSGRDFTEGSTGPGAGEPSRSSMDLIPGKGVLTWFERSRRLMCEVIR